VQKKQPKLSIGHMFRLMEVTHRPGRILPAPWCN